MSLYLIKHRLLIRMRFIDIKSLHVMYCLPFDRLMGLLWIINEFLKLQQKNGSRGTWVRKFSKTLTNLESSVNVNFCQKFGRQEFGTSCKLHFQVSCNNNNNYKKRVVVLKARSEPSYNPFCCCKTRCERLLLCLCYHGDCNADLYLIFKKNKFWYR